MMDSYEGETGSFALERCAGWSSGWMATDSSGVGKETLFVEAAALFAEDGLAFTKENFTLDFGVVGEAGFDSCSGFGRQRKTFQKRAGCSACGGHFDGPASW